MLNYAVLVKGWLDGLPSGNRTREKDDIVYGRAMANTSLLDMYKTIARGIDSTVTDEQTIVATDDSSALFALSAGRGRDDWYQEKAYNWM